MFRTLSLLVIAAFMVNGPNSRGIIAGVVADTQDAGIPKVRVTITNVDTAVDTVLETNEGGAYVARLLIPGNYRISAEHQGFKKFTRDGIVLSVNDSLRIDIELEFSAVTEAVTVTDSAPLVGSTKRRG
jgi:hypothetical protein